MGVANILCMNYARTQNNEDSGSDFDEFGSYDRQSEREPVNDAAEG